MSSRGRLARGGLNRWFAKVTTSGPTPEHYFLCLRRPRTNHPLKLRSEGSWRLATPADLI